MKLLYYFNNLFTNTWQTANNESFEYQSNNRDSYIDKSTIFIFVYIAFGLSVVKYYGNPNTILTLINSFSKNEVSEYLKRLFIYSDNAEFNQRLWWIGSIVLFYLIIPMLIVKFGFKKNLKDFGFSFRNVHNDYPLYLIMLAIMLPIVYFASQTQSFQLRYPIFQPTKTGLLPIFIYWQIAYFIQFVAVEFFFRGFIIHGLKNRFGFYAIFISCIPYCMVHFGKPFGETIAAIVAGIILGTLSMKSRSIVLGILIHYSVAITMDLFALYREGIL
ncbi:MAG: CPBP family intramembrane glutamic endopeptidase [Bacteroidota bacterium]